MEVFAKRLKEERVAQNLSLNEMCERLNIPYSTYTKYEQVGVGNREPDHTMVVKIAKALNVSLDYLFGLID